MKQLLLITLTLGIMACSAKRETGVVQASRAPLLIYKMKQNYSQQVPVGMNADKTKIISYPGPKDLIIGGETAVPTQLIRGYWLDNRGIGPNTVITSFSYDEYIQMESPPTPEELMKSIIDKEPFTEMYRIDLKRDDVDLISKLNSLIRNDLRDCKDLIE